MKRCKMYVVVDDGVDVRDVLRLRRRLESDAVFDRYASEYRCGCGSNFITVVEFSVLARLRSFLGCEYIYISCSERETRRGRFAMYVAHLLNKRVIVEEGGRCE